MVLHVLFHLMVTETQKELSSFPVPDEETQGLERLRLCPKTTLWYLIECGVKLWQSATKGSSPP